MSRSIATPGPREVSEMGFLIIMIGFVVFIFFVCMFIGMVVGGGQYAKQVAEQQKALAEQERRNQGL